MERAQQHAAAGLLYREMTVADIPGGLRLCRAARWNQVESDWRVFLEAGTRGCLVAERDGSVVGTVATLPFGGRFSWISMVLVDPVERGAGIGTRLIEGALEILRDELCVRLDATPAGLPLYKRNGFVEEYAISRLTTVMDSARIPQMAPSVRPMTSEDLPAVLSLDAVAFGADRSFLLGSLFERDPEYAWVAVEGSEIAGYMFGRRGFVFDHLGPVVARDAEIARQLTSASLTAAHGAKVGIDVTRGDASWTAWLEQLGFVEERSLLRMFRGENRYPGRVSHVYAIAGPEFG
jgi:ribosomal protein S18 acetylase RimI-like enzyme